jgi:hypothetical protein
MKSVAKSTTAKLQQTTKQQTTKQSPTAAQQQLQKVLEGKGTK